eukprot:10226-Heterococcus_DN1.PRE.3
MQHCTSNCSLLLLQPCCCCTSAVTPACYYVSATTIRTYSYMLTHSFTHMHVHVHTSATAVYALLAGSGVYDGVMPDSTQRSLTAALSSLSTLSTAHPATGLQQCARLWFQFPAARRIRVRRGSGVSLVPTAESAESVSSAAVAEGDAPAAGSDTPPTAATEGSTATEGTGSYGLTVVRDGTDGSWIIVSDTPPTVTPAISKRSLSCVRLFLVLSVRRLSPLLTRYKLATFARCTAG